jgi:putative ABC transport system ATP-binding protein
MEHFPNQISGGEQQRVAIARALVNNPSIIMADEPTGNLDSKSGEAILKLLMDLNKKGITLIMVTHDNKIASKADRIIYLKDGRIIKEVKK